MPKKKRVRSRKQQGVAVDPDKMAFFIASVLATALLVVCFFYQEVPVADTILRTAIVFAFSYFAAFLLFIFLRRVGEQELAKPPVKPEESGGSGAGNSQVPPSA